MSDDGPEQRMASLLELQRADLEDSLDEEEIELSEAEMHVQELQAALKDIIRGCRMMDQPALRLPPSFEGFVREIIRVATEALNR